MLSFCSLDPRSILCLSVMRFLVDKVSSVHHHDFCGRSWWTWENIFVLSFFWDEHVNSSCLFSFSWVKKCVSKNKNPWRNRQYTMVVVGLFHSLQSTPNHLEQIKTLTNPLHSGWTKSSNQVPSVKEVHRVLTVPLLGSRIVTQQWQCDPWIWWISRNPFDLDGIWSIWKTKFNVTETVFFVDSPF